jgi:mono/diheme cytochrome c family protein
MTLLQATTEAVARHHGPEDPRPAAIAISAFLTAQGAALPSTPGVTPGQPVFPARMRALDESVERGRRRYARQCGACHDAATVAPGVGGFLRTTREPAELFLERHRPAGPPIRWDSLAMADLLAYLFAPRRGEAVAPGRRFEIKEVSR